MGVLRWLIGTACAVFGWAATAAPDRVLLLAPTAAADGEASAAYLQEVLDAARPPADRVQVVLRRIPREDPQRESAIRAALQETSPRVVSTMSMALGRAVQLLAPTVPIVFEGGADPVSMCLVDSLAVPGRNATGYTNDLPEEAKMLEALADAYPRVDHAVVLVDGNEGEFGPCAPQRPLQPRPRCGDKPALQAADVAPLMPVPALLQVARDRHIELAFVELCDAEDLGRLARRIDVRAGTGFIVPTHYLFMEHPAETVEAITRMNAPAVYARRQFLDSGAILALSPRRDARPHQRAYELVARIVNGASPSTIPVQRPSGFDLYVNLRPITSAAHRPSLPTLRRADYIVR